MKAETGFVPTFLILKSIKIGRGNPEFTQVLLFLETGSPAKSLSTKTVALSVCSCLQNRNAVWRVLARFRAVQSNLWFTHPFCVCFQPQVGSSCDVFLLLEMGFLPWVVVQRVRNLVACVFRSWSSESDQSFCFAWRMRVARCQHHRSTTTNTVQPHSWRSAPDAILPGHRRAPQWVPARTPTVHWGPNNGEAVGGPYERPKGEVHMP